MIEFINCSLSSAHHADILTLALAFFSRRLSRFKVESGLKKLKKRGFPRIQILVGSAARFLNIHQFQINA